MMKSQECANSNAVLQGTTFPWWDEGKPQKLQPGEFDFHAKKQKPGVFFNTEVLSFNCDVWFHNHKKQHMFIQEHSLPYLLKNLKNLVILSAL
jgi:hypothetical protein